MKKKLIPILLSLLMLNGCATLHEAYQSTSDTVSGWLGIDDTPDIKPSSQKPENTPAKKAESKTSDDMKIEEMKK